MSAITRTAAVAWTVLAVVLVGALAFAWLAGWRVEAVESGSMAPSIPTGSVLLTKPVAPGDITEGDVITFRDRGSEGRVVMHRVVKVIDREDGRVFSTQGDANLRPDSTFVDPRDVTGRVGWHAAHLGGVVSALQHPLLKVVAIGAPVLLLVGSELGRRRRGAAVEPAIG